MARGQYGDDETMRDDARAGHNITIREKPHFDRLLYIDDQLKALREDRKEVCAQAKAADIDVKVLNRSVKLWRESEEKRNARESIEAEAERIVQAIGELVNTPLGRAAVDAARARPRPLLMHVPEPSVRIEHEEATQNQGRQAGLQAVGPSANPWPPETGAHEGWETSRAEGQRELEENLRVGNGDTSSASTEQAESPPEPPVKRGRGRPRIHPIATDKPARAARRRVSADLLN